ncbi:sporulation-delaying protein SdpB family protein [Microbacterium keratanolyticum]
MQLIVSELRPEALRQTLRAFDLRSPVYTVGRSLLALAQISILLFTPYTHLMQTVLGQGDGPRCGGVRAASIYCLGASAPAWVPTVLMLSVLALVAFGVFPVFVAPFHAWVSFSMAASFTVPDGGDQVAAALSLLLIAVAFGDNRKSIFSRSAAPLPEWRKQVALAGTMFVRIQMATIYFSSAVGKMFAEYWMNGTEEYYVIRDSYFGASGFIAAIMRFLTESAVTTVALTWGSVLAELAIGVLILCGPRARLSALALASLLHGAIAATIGLWSFSLIMIAGVLLASSPVTPEERANLPRFRRAPIGVGSEERAPIG